MIDFLGNITLESLVVLDKSISLEDYVAISISSKNKELTFDVSSAEEWKKYINTYLKNNKAKIAYGGYLEKRDIYNRSTYFSSEDNNRNIHLGIDFWCDADTNVLAVLDGEIHSFKNNTNYGDYGPTIIVKHSIRGKKFYSLYGHLSETAIKNLTVGDRVIKGQIIGQLGDSDVNGDYAPHLHFQLIIDIANYLGDYPGVSSEENIEFYKNNCPNPNLLLKLPNEI